MIKRVLLFLICALTVADVYGQSTYSGISGTVRCGGEPLEAVNIQLTSVSQGSVRGVISNRYGVYSLSGLRPGVYDVAFSSIGYATVHRNGIRLSLGEEYILDVEMSPADNVLSDIDVVAEYSRFNDTRTGQTYSFRSERIGLLPSVNRTLTDYSRLSIYGGEGNSMAGRDGRMTTLNIDGAGMNNSFGLSSDLPGGGCPISLDAVDEVQIVLAPYDVRQSGFVGGGMNVVTKSGSNTMRASAYTYQRNERFRGNNVYGSNLGTRPDESKSVYGLSVSGPLVKDRLFFFVNGELERRPEPITLWKMSADGISDASAMVSRVTPSDMERFSRALKKYGYDAGTADLTDGGTVNEKILARLDWTISDRHNLMVRYNYSGNDQWNEPNGTSTVGLNAPSPRISKNSYVFRKNCYTVRDIAWSAVAELNSLFGKFSNRLLATVSMAGNVRDSESDVFPHIDIWKDGDSFMSAGYELFSLNTGNRTYSYVVSDHLRRVIAHTSVTAGLEYELKRASTSYMQYGSGYYKYASIEDFENGAAPMAFGYTYGFDGVDNPASACSIGNGDAFVQGETDFGNGLVLSYGIRADITSYFEQLKTNRSYLGLDWTRHYFADGENIPEGWKSPVIDTGRWPDTSIRFSPRAGFNWNVSGNGKLVLRGGVGLFSGSMPLVLLTNLPNYSNMLQNTVVVSNDSDGFLSGLSGNFLYSSRSIREYLESRGFNMQAQNDAPVVKGASLCGIAGDFKLPQVMKSSLCADWTLPLGFPAMLTLEGLYCKDVNALYARNVNILNERNFARFSGADTRINYRVLTDGSETSSPLVDGNVTGGAMILDNVSAGYSWSVAAVLDMEPVRNLKLQLSYIHQDTRSVSDMTGSSLYSAWKKVLSVNGPNEAVLKKSAYVLPDRVNAMLTYVMEHRKGFSTSLGIYYEGCSSGRYSYVYSNDMNGDGVANDLIYIPESKTELLFADAGDFSAGEQQEAFWNFVNSDRYLKKHKGGYAEQNGALMPWVNRFDIRLAETFRTGSGKNVHEIQLSVDLMNAGNLLCDRWGVRYSPSACNDGRILSYTGCNENGTPVFKLIGNGSSELLKGSCEPLKSIDSCWYLQIGLRYTFN